MELGDSTTGYGTALEIIGRKGKKELKGGKDTVEWAVAFSEVREEKRS